MRQRVAAGTKVCTKTEFKRITYTQVSTAVLKVAESMEKEIFEYIRSLKNIIVLGDGTFSNTRKARYCLYVMMDEVSKFVLHFDISKLEKNTQQSIKLEFKAFNKALEYLTEQLGENFIDFLVTDGHLKIQDLMKERALELGIVHLLDFWHKWNKIAKDKVLKGIKNTKEGKVCTVTHKVIVGMLKSHFTKCVSLCENKAEKLLELWKTFPDMIKQRYDSDIVNIVRKFCDTFLTKSNACYYRFPDLKTTVLETMNNGDAVYKYDVKKEVGKEKILTVVHKKGELKGRDKKGRRWTEAKDVLTNRSKAGQYLKLCYIQAILKEAGLPVVGFALDFFDTIRTLFSNITKKNMKTLGDHRVNEIERKKTDFEKSMNTAIETLKQKKEDERKEVAKGVQKAAKKAEKVKHKAEKENRKKEKEAQKAEKAKQKAEKEKQKKEQESLKVVASIKRQQEKVRATMGKVALNLSRVETISAVIEKKKNSGKNYKKRQREQQSPESKTSFNLSKTDNDKLLGIVKHIPVHRESLASLKVAINEIKVKETSLSVSEPNVDISSQLYESLSQLEIKFSKNTYPFKNRTEAQ
eukprot:Nk52_evm4s354 gene=Nk52_evmTU4s354